MNDTPATPAAGDRLAKVMARSGLCSRRDAEEWIRAGRVMVNGRKVISPAFNVSDTDKIVVDGAPLAERQGTRVWLYHKPRGLVVTEKDPEGRPTVFESLEEKGLPRVLSVGRLDINTEGLLLLTNDGGLKRVLELPATGWLRKYRVRAHGTITQAQLDSLKAGIEIEGIKYGPIDATLERDQGANVWLELALREGKNREVKNVLGALGLEVNRLIRISFGPFQLGDLPIGAIEVVKARVLKDQLGKRLADEAEADFEAAMPEETTPSFQRGQSRTPHRAPTEERTYGRGTHTTTIAKQRFRFTDRAELSPAEAAARRQERPRPTRPGGGAAPRAPRAAGRSFGRTEEAPPRRIHFDDGREPAVFEEKTYGKKPARGAGAPAGRADGPRPASRASRPFADKPRGGSATGDRPARPFGGKTRSDKAGTDRPPRSYAGKPRGEGTGDRPARSFGDKPRGDRPPRADRPQGADGKGRPFRTRSEGDAAGKPFAGKPRPARSFGDKPGTGGPRTGAPRTGASRADRPASARPAGTGKPRSARPAGTGRPPRKDGPPRSGGAPRRPSGPGTK